jgi:hypothetical protein
MKHKVGDKVKIREDLIVDNEYGSDSFAEEMTQYKGKIATITGVFMSKYDIDIDDGDWNWTDEMLEDIVKDNTAKDNTAMTVEDLLNKTDVEKGGLVISISYPNAYFETTIGHNKINRNSELYKRFIKAYGDMIVDEVSLDVEDDYAVVMKIKLDYCD